MINPKFRSDKFLARSKDRSSGLRGNFMGRPFRAPDGGWPCTRAGHWPGEPFTWPAQWQAGKEWPIQVGPPVLGGRRACRIARMASGELSC